MTAVATPDAARLVFAAVAGLILLLILIIKFKVHAMISILIGAVGIGLMAGMPLSDIIGSVNEGIGNTLKGIALLVGLGSMFGAILEESGGAQTLAVTMVRKFGDEKAAWALGITGLVVAMPVFFDAGLIILIPLAFSLAKRTKRSVLYYVIPLLAGLAVGHAFIPPTPGPVLVASILGVDLGWVILIGIFCGIFAMIAAGPIWGSICGKKYMVEVPEHDAQQADNAPEYSQFSFHFSKGIKRCVNQLLGLPTNLRNPRDPTKREPRFLKAIRHTNITIPSRQHHENPFILPLQKQNGTQVSAPAGTC
mgnify:CR=1 FL=1